MTTARLMFRVALVAAAIALTTTPGQAAPSQPDPRFDPASITTPPLREIQVVKPGRFVLPNGVVVYLLENHDLPLVTGTVYVKTSPSWVPDAKFGLNQLTGEVMRSGGTAAHPGDWLDDRLAAIGASIGTRVGDDFAGGNFRCLSDDVSEVTRLLAEILRQPAFPEDKIELAKVGMRREIAGRNDDLMPILRRILQQAVYQGTPFARIPEYATVEAITREDAIELHRRALEPSRMLVAVYGDFRVAGMKKLLTATFGSWKGAGVALPAAPPVPPLSPSRLVFAPKEDVTQSGVAVAHIGFLASDPDYPAMDVLSTALGGGFQSRLIGKIRTQRGLAYTAGASAGEGYFRPGMFTASTLTRNDSIMVSLGLLRDEVRDVTVNPLKDDELRTAKETTLNTFVFNFESPAQVLFRAAYYELIGYPQDFLQRYQKGVEAVTAQSALEAARRRIHPDQAVIAIVGKEKEFDQPLESVGVPVERVDLTIPPPPSKLKAGDGSPEAMARGQALLAKAAQVAGGPAAWSALRSVVVERDDKLTLQGQTMSMKTTMQWQLPDKYVSTRTLPMGEIKQGYDGTTGWMSAMGQVQDEPRAAEQVKKQYERSLFRLFSNPSALELQALDPQSVDGVRYDVALVKSESTKDWLLFFGPDGSLARMEYMGEGPQGGPAKETEIFGDWRVEGAVQYPHLAQGLMDGQPFLEGKVTSIRLNAAIDPQVFKKPEK